MRRSVFDLASQIMPLAVSLLDRLLLTALLIRVWTVAPFEQWSLLVATATMLSILDMGSQISFSNRMAAALHSDVPGEAVQIFQESNMIFLGLAASVAALSIAITVI